MAIWATIWATCDTARLVGLPRDGPAGCDAWLPVRGPPCAGGLLYGLPTASTLARWVARSTLAFPFVTTRLVETRFQERTHQLRCVEPVGDENIGNVLSA